VAMGPTMGSDPGPALGARFNLILPIPAADTSPLLLAVEPGLRVVIKGSVCHEKFLLAGLLASPVLIW